jgi:hypothetical protein
LVKILFQGFPPSIYIVITSDKKIQTKFLWNKFSFSNKKYQMLPLKVLGQNLHLIFTVGLTTDPPTPVPSEKIIIGKFLSSLLIHCIFVAKMIWFF